MVWDVGKKQTFTLKAHSKSVSALAFSANAAELASGGEDGRVHLWATATGTEKGTAIQESGTIAALTYSPEGKYLAVCAGGGSSLRIYHADGSLLAKQPQLTAGAVIRCMSFNKLGTTLFTANSSGQVQMWEVEEGIPLQDSFSAGMNGVRATSFGRGGLILAAAGDEGAVRFLDSITGQERCRIPVDGSVQALALAPDERALAVATNDGRVLAWCVPSELEIYESCRDALARELAAHRVAPGNVSQGESATRSLENYILSSWGLYLHRENARDLDSELVTKALTEARQRMDSAVKKSKSIESWKLHIDRVLKSSAPSGPNRSETSDSPDDK
jgi:WD40 repeat protein